MNEKNINRFLFYTGPILAIICYWLTPNLEAQQRSLAAIMLLVIIWWLAPLIPLAVTGLIGVCLAAFFGVASFPTALEGFSHPVIFLFMGGFFIAEAIKANQLDTWIARRFLTHRLIQGRPVRLYLAIVILTCLFSMFLSNTATTAMLIPIALSLFHHLNITKESKAASLILMIPWASSIGGIATPIGSIPNAIAISLLNKNLGINVSFFEWMMKSLPVMVLAMLVMILLFQKELASLNDTDCLETQAPAALTRAQKKLITVILITVSLWLLPGLFQIFFSGHPFTTLIMERLPEGLVAILISGLLFFIPSSQNQYLLSWKDAQKIDWGSLLLFGSGIALGQMMFQTGLAKLVSSSMQFDQMTLTMAILVIITFTLFITEVVSNTAVANLLIPLLITTEPFISHPTKAAMGVAMASSMAFMLPVGTPPNAMAFGTGLVKIQWMIKKGIWLNLACVLVIWLFTTYWF